MRRDPLAGYDLGLLFCVLTLLAIGVLMVYSASGVRALDALDNPQHYLILQSAWGLGGLMAMAATARLDYRRLRPLALPLLAITTVLLVLVLVPGLGVQSGGAVRWLRFAGPLGIQPAELAKLALLLYLAAWFASRAHELSRGGVIARFVLVVGGLVGLVVAEPDLGTAAILALVALATYFAAGARLREFALVAALGIVGVAALAVATPYRLTRVLAFLDPWSEPAGRGFHTVQQLYALALGGVFGEGLGAGREKFGFLPAPYTDSIFAVLADELGLVGALAVIALFGVIVVGGLRIARRAPDLFGALLAVGITVWLGGQAWVNMAVVANLVPITGIPLPFISYGGSSLVVSLMAVGILLSVGRQGTLGAGRYGSDTDPARRRRDRRSHQPAPRGRGRDPRADPVGALRLRRRT